jgi:hypothetical protein
MAELIFKNNPRTFALTKKLTTVSASVDADIRLADKNDSLCYIEKRDDDSYHIETIKGKGITVNNKLVKHCKLKFGDLVETGEDTAVFLDKDEYEQKTGELKPSKNIELLFENNKLIDISRIVLNKLMGETYAEKGMVLLLEDGEPSILVGAEKDGMEFLSGFSETIIKTVLLDKKPLISNNVLTDERFSPSKSIVALKIMATIVVPILKSNNIYGVVYLWNSDAAHPFSDSTLEITRFYAWIFSVLIENERLKHGIHTTMKRVQINQKLMVWHNLISLNPEMIHIFEQCDKLARTQSNIVFYGEQGTGKKSFVKALHEISNPGGYLYMLKVKNKTTDVLSDELSLLSGIDLREKESGGKVFIVVDGLEYFPEELYSAMIGIFDTFHDARWMFLMERNPDAEESPLDKRLRTRLGEIIVRVPALRERTEDIDPLAARFLDEFCGVYSKDIKGFSEKAERLLQTHRWNGNVAELRDVIRKAVIGEDSDMLESGSLGLESSDAVLSPLGKAKEEFMKRYIKTALEITNGDKIKAADMLRVSHRTIYKYLED